MRSRGVERGPVRVTGGKLRRMRAIISTGVGYLQDHYLRPSPLYPPLLHPHQPTQKPFKKAATAAEVVLSFTEG